MEGEARALVQLAARPTKPGKAVVKLGRPTCPGTVNELHLLAVGTDGEPPGPRCRRCARLGGSARLLTGWYPRQMVISWLETHAAELSRVAEGS